ncbi:MAG: hypothetical protein FGM41_06885 [Bacteroidetes bacterium]|nr:hypothetical protein [Bacteroidota bacterium]
MKIFFSLLIFIGLSFVSLVYANPSAKVFPQIQYGYIENKGQLHNQFGELNTEVKYILATPSLNVHLKQTGFSLEMHVGDTPMVKYHRIDISFEGANPYCLIEPDLKANDYINYYINYTKQSGVHAGKGQTNVAHYGKVTYRQVYPGIDIEFLLDKTSGQLQYKYNLIVSPGAELARVRFKVKGAQGIELNGKGNLVFKTSLGQIEESIPFSYLEANATQKQEAKVNYQLHNQETFGFSILVNNKTSKLVIDPIGWATYFGGSVNNQNGSGGNSIYSRNLDTITFGGFTNCISGIATIGSYLGLFQGNADCFLAKFTANGTLVWSTYYGGSDVDNIVCLVIDTVNEIYVGGSTRSNSGMATIGAFKSRKGNSYTNPGFLSKFTSNGFLVWGTYLSDSSNSGGLSGVSSLDYSTNGRVYLVSTVSGTTGLATTGTHSATQPGYVDIIIMVFNLTGGRVWATYYGSDGWELRPSVKVNGLNEAYVSGFHYGGGTGLTTTGAHKTVAQSNEGFLAKFNANGNRIWGTFVGGAGMDTINDLTLDTAGNIYVCGSTSSTADIATTGAYFPTNNPATTRAFINKFNPQGVRQWGTYYSGNAQTFGLKIKVDKNGNPVLGGTTFSTTGIATANTYQTSLNGVLDIYLAKLNSSGTARLWGTYFGGNNTETITDIFINKADEIYITGSTSSTSGIASTGAHQTLNLTTEAS